MRIKGAFSSPSHRPGSVWLARSTHSTPPPTPPWPVPCCNPRSLAGWSELECASASNIKGEARRDGMRRVGLSLSVAVVRYTTGKEEAVTACKSSCEPHSSVARIGSYRSLACVSLLCPRREQDDDELRGRREDWRREAAR